MNTTKTEVKFSIFSNAKQTVPTSTISEEELLENIKSAWKEEITELREVYQRGESEEREKELKLNLPAITLSGIFEERNKEKLLSHSGRLQIDIDNLSERGFDPETYKRKLKELPWIKASFLSPRGNGVKAIAVIPPCKNDQEHKEVFEQIDEALNSRFPELRNLNEKGKLESVNDHSVKDVSRLCFVSYDPGILINENPIEFPFRKKTSEQKPKEEILTRLTEQDFDELTISKALEVIPPKQKDDGRYSEIRDLIWSLVSKLGHSRALSFASSLIGSSSSMNAQDLVNQYEEGKLSLGTFFEIAKRYGFDQKEFLKRNKENVKSEIIESRLSEDDQIKSLQEEEKLLKESWQEFKAKKKALLLETKFGDIPKNDFLAFEFELNLELDLLKQGKGDIGKIEALTKKIKNKSLQSQSFSFERDFGSLLREEGSRDIGFPLPDHWEFYEKLGDKKRGQIFMKRGLPTTVGAFSGAGKSTFLLNLLFDAILQKRKSIFFTLEMTESQLSMNLYRIFMRAKHQRSYDIEEFIHKVKLPDEETFIGHFQNLIRDHLSLVYCRGKSSSEIIQIFDQFCDSNKIEPDQVFLDYLQIISPEKTSEKKERRIQMIETMELLTDKISQTKSAWIISAQTNRSSHKEENLDHSSFQESASIEQNSGLAIVLKRERLEDSDKDILTINVSKNRFGACRFEKLYIDRRSQYIERPVPEEEKPEKKGKKK